MEVLVRSSPAHLVRYALHLLLHRRLARSWLLHRLRRWLLRRCPRLAAMLALPHAVASHAGKALLVLPLAHAIASHSGVTTERLPAVLALPVSVSTPARKFICHDSMLH
jgi:hypothetical protein